MLMRDLKEKDPERYAKEWEQWCDHNPQVCDFDWWEGTIEFFFEDKPYLDVLWVETARKRVRFDLGYGKCATDMHLNSQHVLTASGHLDSHPIESFQFITDLPFVRVSPDRFGWMSHCYINTYGTDGGVGLLEGYSQDETCDLLDKFIAEQNIHDVFMQFAKDTMFDLLKELEAQHDYLTSEEYFLETEFEDENV